MPEKSNIYLALLRGINVGGNNIISMADLKASLEELGYTNVKSYGNSGNIIFMAESAEAHKEIEAHLEKELTARFSINLRVFVRSLDDLTQVLAEMPADWQTPKPAQKYDLIFLGRTIDQPEIVAQLAPKPELELLQYCPGVLFWSISVKNFSKSKIGKLVGTPLYQEMTIRGPGTVRKAYDLMVKLSQTV